jgi:RNA polymerase sigma-70 factor (ECF subfamily)
MNNASRIFDGLLVLYYRSGDRKALGMLVERYQARLCRHAFWYTRNTEVSRDIVQDSWRQVIKNIGSLQDPDKFGSWVMTIVTRKALDYISHTKRDREYSRQNQPLSVEMEEEFQTERHYKLMQLKKAIESLDYKQQEVIRLFYVEGYSLLEIGRILGIPSGTVKSRLFHARERLKSILK